MYSLNMPVSALRTKMRQEFERHRYVNQIGVVDVLLAQSHAEYQVRGIDLLLLGYDAGVESGVIHVVICMIRMEWVVEGGPCWMDEEAMAMLRDKS
jgi:hypothetical protein